MTVNTRRFDNVAVVEMNRPERKNAMNTALLAALLEALQAMRAEASVDAVVVIGAQGTFSSGADTSEQVDDQGVSRRIRLFNDVYETMTGFPKPTVAAIAGHCIGGGAEVAAACDLRVGTATTRVRFPGAHFGIPVGVARLPLLIGLSHAKDLLMTSRTVEAGEAFRMGFVNRIVEEADLEHEAVALAASIAANRGAMVTKRLLDEASGLAARVRSESRTLARWRRSVH